jgi:hypothetical protein
MAEQNIHQVVDVPAPPEAVHHQVLSVSGADSYAPMAVTPQWIALYRKRFPVWAIVLAVVFFPLGLLFLLAREEHNVGINFEPIPGGTRVTISGQASRPLMSALHYVLTGHIATPAGLPPMPPMPPPPPGPPPPGPPTG